MPKKINNPEPVREDERAGEKVDPNQVSDEKGTRKGVSVRKRSSTKRDE